MTQLNGNHSNHIDSAHDARYETPAFAPGTAFSWTLRSAEIARRAQQTRWSKTPAFAPGIAFSWTLRSAEIARERRATAHALAA
jgi:hypothetical protein